MMQNATRFLSSALLLASLAPAQDYFPLAVGNQWIYRDSKETIVTGIEATEKIGDREYFIYQGITGQRTRLRYNDKAQLVALQDNGSEGLWADFNADRYDTKIEQCTGPATVVARDYAIDLGKQTLGGGIAVRYAPSNCADAGITRDVFVHGIGLAEREITSFIGPKTYRLIYARLGGLAVFGQGEHAFRLSLDRVAYPRNAEFEARLTLENSTGQPLLLRFNSGQSFDLRIKNDRGEHVYTWSATRLFIAVMRDEAVVGEKNWTTSDRLALDPGQYTMEAVLTTLDRQPYLATVPFTILP